MSQISRRCSCSTFPGPSFKYLISWWKSSSSVHNSLILRSLVGLDLVFSILIFYHVALFSSFQIYSTSFIDNKYLFFFFLCLPAAFFSLGSTNQPTNHRQHHPVLRHASTTEFLFKQPTSFLLTQPTDHYSLLTSLDDRHVLCFPV